MQPNLNPDSGLVAQAVALADLGAAGMDGPQRLIRETYELFLEDNLDFARALSNVNNISLSEQSNYRQRLLEWIQVQIDFVNGRKARLAVEL